jgi:hypothetical protein
MNNRRSEPRFIADQPVSVRLLDSQSASTCGGMIVDFSASGIAIHIPVPVEIGCRMEIKWPRGMVIAEVRNCRRDAPDKYRIGLKIREIVAIAEFDGHTSAA